MKRREFIKNTVIVGASAYMPLARSSIQDTAAISITGEEITLQRSEILELMDELEGNILTAGDYWYNKNRLVWNGVWDKYPALIAECSSKLDVINALNFAREHNLLVAVRGGGHSISGKSTCDGGIIIDLSRMRRVSIDLERKIATVEGGAHLHDLDSKSLPHGLVCPAGVVSHTGIAGLTLGGGVGWLMRSHGLTIDNLLAVDIVTPDGQLRRASLDENPDLFWGIRGGGGNFGIVISFQFKLSPLGIKGNVIAGARLYDIKYAKELWDFYYDYTESTMPRNIAINAGMWNTPDGKEGFFFLSTCYTGDVSKADRLLEPIRSFGKPISDNIGTTNFLDLQQALDKRNAHYRKYYIKGRHIDDYDPKMNEALLERWRPQKGRFDTMRVVRFGGAISEVGETETAWSGRNAKWDIEVGGHWADPNLNEKYTQWGRDYWKALTPYCAERIYVNELMDEDQAFVKTSYGQNYKRLEDLKNKYDPKNLLSLNANIKPTV
jgi:hypothetical protein